MPNPKIAYRWRDGRRYPVSAQVVGERLAVIRKAKGGFITAEDVLEDARDPNSPLRECLTLERDKAAHLYNLDEARHIIRDCVAEVVFRPSSSVQARSIEYEVIQGSDAEPKDPAKDSRKPPDVPGHVRVFHPERGSVYMATPEALADPTYRAQVLDEALRGLKQWRARWANLTEFASVFKAIDGLEIK